MVDQFWEAPGVQNKRCFGKSKIICQNLIPLPFLQCHWGCLYYKSLLGLSILQITITIKESHYLGQPLPNKVLCHRTHTQTITTTNKMSRALYLTLQRLCSLLLSMGRAATPPNHGASAPLCHMQAASRWARARCCWFACLGGAT